MTLTLLALSGTTGILYPLFIFQCIIIHPSGFIFIIYTSSFPFKETKAICSLIVLVVLWYHAPIGMCSAASSQTQLLSNEWNEMEVMWQHLVFRYSIAADIELMAYLYIVVHGQVSYGVIVRYTDSGVFFKHSNCRQIIFKNYSFNLWTNIWHLLDLS